MKDVEINNVDNGKKTYFSRTQTTSVDTKALRRRT